MKVAALIDFNPTVQWLSDSSHKNSTGVEPSLLTLRPESVARFPPFNSSTASDIVISVELTVVVLPCTVKSPLITNEPLLSSGDGLIVNTPTPFSVDDDTILPPVVSPSPTINSEVLR